MTTWIVSAGDRGRDYRKHFFRFGLAFFGTDAHRGNLQRMVAGDVVLLKRGVTEFLAAGTIVARDGVVQGDRNKDWLQDFDGWDLRAWCNVDWHVPLQADPATGLRRGTLYETNQPQHLDAARRLLDAPLAERQPEPAPTDGVSHDTILEFLVSQGLRPSAADELTQAIRKIRLLADYYYKHANWDDVREHEIRAFLVLPLLVALGWAEQQMKVELPCTVGRIDIACFSRPYRGEAQDCVVLIETKDFGSGLDFAPDQARTYARDFPSCQVLLVSNGYCYKTFLRSAEGSFSDQPSAYLNLLNPRSRYPLDPQNVAGALEAVKWLLPGSLR